MSPFRLFSLLILIIFFSFGSIVGCDGGGDGGGPGGSCDHLFTSFIFDEIDCAERTDDFQCGGFIFDEITTECTGLLCSDCLCSAIDLGPFFDVTEQECDILADQNACLEVDVNVPPLEDECQLFDCIIDTPCGPFS